MGAITIHVTDVNAANDHQVQASCAAVLDSGETGEVIYFTCTWDHDALAATVNAAIKEAAISEADSQASYTVGVLDKKTLIGGAVGL